MSYWIPSQYSDPPSSSRTSTASSRTHTTEPSLANIRYSIPKGLPVWPVRASSASTRSLSPGRVRTGALGQRALPPFGVQRPEPVLRVHHLRSRRVAEHGLVLRAHVGDGLRGGGLEGLLDVGHGRYLLHERPVAGLGPLALG